MADQCVSSAVHAQPAAELPVEGDLPVDVLVLVLLLLKGDVSSLCAAACVATTWRNAAASPRLWTKIGPFSANAVANLTDARLKQLVLRAKRGLRNLNLQNIARSCLTDEGVAKALRREKRIVVFAANGKPLTGAGIAVALAPSRGRLRRLLVSCIPALPEPEDAGPVTSIQQDAFLVKCKQPLVELRALLAPEGSMKATAVCQATTGNGLCTRMCDNKSSCECGATYCMLHSDRVGSCGYCVDPICERCTSLAEDICDGCFLELEDRDDEFDIYDI